MKITQRCGRAAFTLIEMMAVVTIIVILAGIVVTSMGYITERQARSKAKVQIALLSQALEEYKLDMGTYPTTKDVTSFTTTTGTATSATSLWLRLFKEGYDYTNLTTPPSNWGTKATRIYCPDLNPISSNQGWVNKATTMPTTNIPVVDPWGNEYCYRSAAPLLGSTPNPATLNPDFDLWSMGKDGKTNPAVPGDKVNLDDIKNF